MLKALLKKQLLEFGNLFILGKKNGKPRTKKGKILSILFFAILSVYLMGAVFLLFNSLSAPLLSNGLGVLYFTLSSLICFLMGVLGTAFTTYSTLYTAKDNDLMLSMPIPPEKLLFSKLLSSFIMTAVYYSIINIPSIIAYAVSGFLTAKSISFLLILSAFNCLFCLTVSCVLGYLIAVISRKIKRKSLMSLIFTVVFLAVYFYFYFSFSGFIKDALDNGNLVLDKMKSFAFPFYVFGEAVNGNVIYFLLFAIVSAVLFAIVYLILTKTFIKIASYKGNGAKNVKKEGAIKVSSLQGALLKKELKRFLTCPTYFINAGLGVVLMIAIAVVSLFFSEKTNEIISQIPSLSAMKSTTIVAIISFFLSTITISASSVSLEGKALYNLKALPISTLDILRAKVNLHAYISAISSVFTAVCFSISLGLDFEHAVFTTVVSYILSLFYARLGVVLNLKHPNFDWTNETYVVKQSMPVTIVIFGGFGISLAIMILAVISWHYIDPMIYLGGLLVVFTLLARLLDKWITKKGVEIFEKL